MTGERLCSSRGLSICKIWDADYPWDIRVEKVSTSLVEAGHSVHLICRNAARRPRHEAQGGFVIHRLPSIPRILGPAHSACNFPHPFNPVWAHAIGRAVRDVRADLIFVRDLPLAVPAALIGRRRSIPVVFGQAVVSTCRKTSLQAAEQFLNFMMSPRIQKLLLKYGFDAVPTKATVG